MNRSHPSYLAVVWACCALSIACGGDSTGPTGRVVASITVTPDPSVLYPGGSRTLTAVAADAADSVIAGVKVTWSSSTPAVATVTSTGLVTAVGVGVDTIRATSGSIVGQAVLTVTLVPADTVSIAPTPPTLYLTQARQLSATVRDSAGQILVGRTVVWASSDSTHATVSSLGVVTAVGVGGATITATVNGHSGAAALTIDSVPVTTVALIPSGDTVVVGDTLAPVAVARDSAGHVVPGKSTAWAVSDSSVLQPISAGRFVVLTTGNVTLSATMAGVGGTGPVAALNCGDTLHVVAGSFNLPLISGGLANDPSGTIDAGIFNGAAAWYGGGVMYGTDSAHMVVTYDPSQILGTGAAVRGICQFTSGPPYVGARATVAPLAGLGAPAGLRVVQESFVSTSAATNAAYILLRYTFTDTSAVPITGLRVGFIADWDLGTNPGFNLLDYVAANGTHEALEQDSVTHTERLGLAGFTASGAMTSSGWLNGTDPGARGAYYARLAAGTQAGGAGPGDVRALAGLPVISIPAYGRTVVYFAVVGGTTPATFTSSRASAKALADALGYN